MELNLKRLSVEGSGDVQYSTATGSFTQKGNLHLEAKVGSSRANGAAGIVEIAPDSWVRFDTNELALGPGHIATSGVGSLELALRDFKGRTSGVVMDGEGATISGRGNVSIDGATGISMSGGNFMIDTTLRGGDFATQGDFQVKIDGKVKVNAVLEEARLARDGAVQLKFGKTAVSAKAKGTIKPKDITKPLLAGSLDIDLRTLVWDSQGNPTLTGNLRVEAEMDSTKDLEDVSIGPLWMRRTTMTKLRS